VPVTDRVRRAAVLLIPVLLVMAGLGARRIGARALRAFIHYETEKTAQRATYFDLSEIGLEVGIVLCSIALLTGGSLFWRIAFIPMAVGVAVAAVGLVLK